MLELNAGKSSGPQGASTPPGAQPQVKPPVEKEKELRPADSKPLTAVPTGHITQGAAAQPLAPGVVLGAREGERAVLDESGQPTGQKTEGVIAVGETQPGAPLRPITTRDEVKPEDKPEPKLTAAMRDGTIAIRKGDRKLFINPGVCESIEDADDTVTFKMPSGKTYSFEGDDAVEIRKVLNR